MAEFDEKMMLSKEELEKSVGGESVKSHICFICEKCGACLYPDSDGEIINKINKNETCDLIHRGCGGLLKTEVRRY